MPEEPREGEWEAIDEKARMRLIVAVIALTIVTIFVVSNTDSVDIQFVTLKATMPAWILYSILLFTGIAIGWAVGGLRRRAKSKSARNK